MKFQKACKILVLCLLVSSCATSRDLTSKHFLPEWENRIVNLPKPSETSAGHWAAKTTRAFGEGVSRVVLFPFAVLGNVVLNAYFIPTWPLRWLFRGDKRLVVWHPLFRAGQEAGSDFFSKEWNADLV